MINRVQSSKVKTKLKFQQSISIFYDEINIRIQSGTFQSEEDIFSKNSENNKNFIMKYCFNDILAH